MASGLNANSANARARIRDSAYSSAHADNARGPSLAALFAATQAWNAFARFSGLPRAGRAERLAPYGLSHQGGKETEIERSGGQHNCTDERQEPPPAAEESTDDDQDGTGDDTNPPPIRAAKKYEDPHGCLL